MPRRPRILLDGGFYHVLTRGNDKRRLFTDRQDHVFFLNTIRIYLAKFQVRIVHYCLMPTHLHFLARLDAAGDLPKFMQGILQVYGDYFRRKYHSFGFIFQNRYKSLLIDSESYLLECGRYIERNPLRAGLVDDLSQYPWSSYNFYANGNKDDLVSLVDSLYLDLANRPQERKALYKKYVLAERPYDLIVDKTLKI
ncbi:MAG: transposase [Candidatus Omnitrophica bacterium]|nr:transposase [Candidatus Omnitrophota bacterium]MDD5654321.1 transposase [Candidatus Omnitrophota bacterium]